MSMRSMTISLTPEQAEALRKALDEEGGLCGRILSAASEEYDPYSSCRFALLATWQTQDRQRRRTAEAFWGAMFDEWQATLADEQPAADSPLLRVMPQSVTGRPPLPPAGD